MKILLVGEYSRLHNSLKEGLVYLGHEVVIVSTGDSFKNYNTNFSIAPAFINRNLVTRTIKRIAYKLFIDLEKIEKAYRFYGLLPQLSGYDYVQLINSDAIETYPYLTIRLFKKLLRQNKTISLLICGDETPITDYNLDGKLKYSVLTPYLNNRKLKKEFYYPLKYSTKPYRKVFDWICSKTAVLISSDLDYEIPMRAMGYKTMFIPNPINIDSIAHHPVINHEKIVLFLGINRMSYIKKGICYFEEALKVIDQKYGDVVEIIVTENVPYASYISLYDSAHIVLDQVYAYDQGYNALEAMAKGKVVFTGAENEFNQHYNLNEEVAINALPDVDAIVADLSYLIEHPEKIVAMGNRARKFIETEHNYIAIAQSYLNAWGGK
jgi:glycosyltransferase involved in cell wall biosynthesis